MPANDATGRAPAGLAAIVGCVACALAAGGEVQLLNCDAAWTDIGGGGSCAAVAGVEGAGAIEIQFPALGAASSLPYVYRDLPAGVLHPTLDWAQYQGIRMRVRGDGSCAWGVLDLRDAHWYRYYAVFPLSAGSWTEVTVPWREFVQRNWVGSIDAVRTDTSAADLEITVVAFSMLVNQMPGHPPTDIPARAFRVDDIRLFNGETLSSTPISPAGTTSVDATVAKMLAGDPVSIVVLGASIDWGFKLANDSPPADPATDSWPAVLEGLLRTQYGYPGITVTSRAFNGANSYELASLVGDCVYAASPDLVILGAIAYNDSEDFVDDGALTAGEKNARFDNVADNARRIYGMLLRSGCDVMQSLSGLRVEGPTDIDDMDPIYDRMASICGPGDMNVFTADVYGELSALGGTYLASAYYDIGGDPAHPNAACHEFMATVVSDAVAAVNPTPGPGTVQFQAATASAWEGTQATLYVTRTGGSAGAASVSWSTADLTAVAGVDYAADSGVLNWADGDATAKSIVVTTLEDDVEAADRTFSVTLGAATGSSLGTTVTAAVTVVDDDGVDLGTGSGGVSCAADAGRARDARLLAAAAAALAVALAARRQSRVRGPLRTTGAA